MGRAFIECSTLVYRYVWTWPSISASWIRVGAARIELRGLRRGVGRKNGLSEHGADSSGQQDENQGKGRTAYNMLGHRWVSFERGMRCIGG
jgi:hypothetical protein